MAQGKKSAAKTIAIQDRREQAVQLRRAGLSIRDIAQRLDVSGFTIHDDLKTMLAEAVKENVDNAEQLRALEVERLDRVMLQLSPLVFPTKKKDDRPDAPAPLPDLKAVDRYLRLSEQRAKLLGLYAPVKTEHSGTIELSWQDQAVAMIERGELTQDKAMMVFDNDSDLVDALFARAKTRISTRQDQS